jgi:hypothetical protein
VMDEELVEAREPAHPSEAEGPSRRARPQRRDDLGEVPLRERSPSSFRKASPRPGQDKPGAGGGAGGPLQTAGEDLQFVFMGVPALPSPGARQSPMPVPHLSLVVARTQRRC